MAGRGVVLPKMQGREIILIGEEEGA